LALYLKRKDDRGIHNAKIYNWVELRFYRKYTADIAKRYFGCEVSGEWKFFSYFKDEIVPICQNLTQRFIKLCAWAPPNYTEKPLYYPLVEFVYYPNNNTEDNTVYCTRNNEYKKEKGFSPEILGRNFEEKDRRFSMFDDFGSADFGSAPYITGLASTHQFISACIYYENLEAVEEGIRKVSSNLMKDNFTLVDLGGFKMKDNSLVPKKLEENELISKHAVFTRNDEKIDLLFSTAVLGFLSYNYEYYLELCSEWNGNSFLYLQNLIPSLFVRGNEVATLRAWAPPNYKERPLYHPLIEFIYYPDGTIVDKTVYVTKKNKYKDEIGFKPEILNRKLRKKSK